MYIDKWWGNVTCGDTEDSMTLQDYFGDKIEEKVKIEFNFNNIIKDAQLDKIWGKTPLHVESGIECRFYFLDEDDEQFHTDIDIPINLIIDLGALLLQSLVEGTIALFEDDDGEDIEFSISAEKKEIQMLIAELEKAVQEPHLYYPDFLQDEFAEMKDGIIEIYTELKSYC